MRQPLDPGHTPPTLVANSHVPFTMAAARMSPSCALLAGLVLLSGTALGQVQPKAVPQPRPATPNNPAINPAGPQPGLQPGLNPGVQPGAQPGARPTTTLAPAPPSSTPQPTSKGGPADAGSDTDMVMLPAFAEPVQLTALIEMVARTLNINIAVQGDVPGTVVFNAPVPVKKSDLINLLDSFLEAQQFTITKDRFGQYTVHNAAQVAPHLGNGDESTTKVFKTPNIRPSALKAAIDAQLGTTQGGHQAAYFDELGLIMITDTPRRVAVMGELIDRLLSEAGKTTFTRIELKNLAASVARERALQLVGQINQRAPGLNNAVDPAQAGLAQPRAGTLDNLGDRLVVDAQGNALIFRGVPEEITQVRTVLNVIDVPNNLLPKTYIVGSSGTQIANIAHQQGLGEVTSITSTDQSNGGGFDFNAMQQINQQRQNQSQAGLSGGPMMVVDEGRGIIIYYGTPAQQQQLAALVKELDPGAEKIIIGVYKLKNSDAEQVAQVILGLIQNTTPVGTGSLLPNGGQPASRTNPNGRTRTPTPTTPPANRAARPGGQGGNDLTLDSSGFVVADKANNQILIKAPAGQQPEFARLIDKLDMRRPQVYIEAKIIAVNWRDDLRTAFETQIQNIGQASGFLNTNFGLSSFGTTGSFTGPKTVATGLGGLTAAVIKSDQVPIIINALQTKADARVLSTPQLLVDDNEDAEITSVDTQPTSSISRGTTTGSDIITSGPDDEAGTKLSVTPQISEGGYLRLKYELELSSFTGAQTVTSSGTLPAPKQVNKMKSTSVTVPADTTVIIGGLNFDAKSITRIQVPLLGDIPLLGLLFQDRSANERKTTLYIFLTPRILRDPTFADLRLMTAGPQAEMHLAADLPRLRTAPIDITRSTLPARGPEFMLNYSTPIRSLREESPHAPVPPAAPASAPAPLSSPADEPPPAPPIGLPDSGSAPASPAVLKPIPASTPARETKTRRRDEPGPSNDDR